MNKSLFVLFIIMIGLTATLNAEVLTKKLVTLVKPTGKRAPATKKSIKSVINITTKSAKKPVKPTKKHHKNDRRVLTKTTAIRNGKTIVRSFVQNTFALDPVPTEQSIKWENWSGNNQYTPDETDGLYYLTPKNFNQLQQMVSDAATQGKIIRVQGQRHSATPLIVNENNTEAGKKHGKILVVDLSQYSDLGDNSESNVVLDTANSTVTVNTGVTESDLDTFLTMHNFMLKTVTAGGMFAIGGITAVDVHGAAMNSTIFSGNVIAYTVLKSNGQKVTYDEQSEKFDGYSPLQFFRTSLGTLGVVTSVTLQVLPRAHKNTLVPSYEHLSIPNKEQFIETYMELFNGDYNSIESFYNPYHHKDDNILTLRWKIDNDPVEPIPNDGENYKDQVCSYLFTAYDGAEKGAWGTPLLGDIEENLAEEIAIYTQNNKLPEFGKLAIDASTDVIKSKMNKAIKDNHALWLDTSERAMFMSYFIPLPDSSSKGMGQAWDTLQVFVNQLKINTDYVSVLPPEFRFVRGSDALLSGTYSTNKDQLYISIEVLAITGQGSTEGYSQNVLDYFANIEYQWVLMGGFPHNGKMYGFYNPKEIGSDGTVKGVPPLNANYMEELKSRKQQQISAFSKFQKMLDPKGVFCNEYTSSLGICELNLGTFMETETLDSVILEEQ